MKQGEIGLKRCEGNWPKAFPVGSLTPEIVLESGARVESVCPRICREYSLYRMLGGVLVQHGLGSKTFGKG